MTLSIFLIGATGYIGGSVLDAILHHPKKSEFEITILLRGQEKAKGFESFGLKTVIGSLTDFDLLEKQASESDIIFECADADDANSTGALLKGLKTRFEKTGKRPVLIHTSGTGVLVENAMGKHAGTTIYSDLNIPQIESLPDSQIHRKEDKLVVAADEEGYVYTYLVLPSTIWGLLSNDFTKQGLQKGHSQQIPNLIKRSLARKNAVIINEGLNIWPHIEVTENAHLYYLLFDAIISGKNPAHGREGYYFAENGEYVQKDLATAVAQELYALGKIEKPEPVPLTAEEEKAPFMWFMGTNSRCRADRARSTLGWKPVKGDKEFIASIKPEVDYYIASNNL